MTHPYRFVGAVSQIGTHKLEKFGAKINLSDAEALNAIDGGAQLCPEEHFHFAEEELKRYATAKHRKDADEDFQARHRAAIAAVAAHLEVLKEREAARKKAEAEAAEKETANE